MSDENKLTVFGMNTAELGKALVDGAQQKQKEQTVARMMSEVQILLETNMQILSEQTRLAQNLVIVESRLQALNDGAFTLTKTAQIVYNDPSLNEGYRLRGE